MWRSLKNLVTSFSTYSDLSPDLKMRRRVNQQLRDRPNLSAEEWHKTFWQPLNISQEISNFVYSFMQTYSGLEFGRTQPDDHLEQDLYLSLICWFDWQITLEEDFYHCFGIKLGALNLDAPEPIEPERNDETNESYLIFATPAFSTVEELVLSLNHQLLSAAAPEK